jgi:hypothetical protein
MFLIVYALKERGLEDGVIERIRPAILCISNSDNEVLATAMVWDYTRDHVLLLTNYHTWVDEEFKYCFPPKDKKDKNKRKHEEEVKLKLHNEDGFALDFDLSASSFHSWEKETDFAVLQLPKKGFNMKRIPIMLNLFLTMKVHAFGYIGHSNEFNISSGEVAGMIPEGFSLNLLSAPGFSGAATLADGHGRAIGYMGGNFDASKDKNSQHHSYAFRFDRVMIATKRNPSPSNSPSGKAAEDLTHQTA